MWWEYNDDITEGAECWCRWMYCCEGWSCLGLIAPRPPSVVEWVEMVPIGELWGPPNVVQTPLEDRAFVGEVYLYSVGWSVRSVTFLWKVSKTGSGRKNLSLFRKPGDPHLTAAQVFKYCRSSGYEFSSSVSMSSRRRMISLLSRLFREFRSGIRTCGHSVSR